MAPGHWWGTVTSHIGEVFRLATRGDAVERRYWTLFIQREFPSYELFWQRSVAPLTNRPDNIRFKRPADLAALGKGDEDLCMAQLHDTVLAHLAVAYELRKQSSMQSADFTHVIIRLCLSADAADELLQRVSRPVSYEPWEDNEGQRARTDWRKDHDGLLDLLNYRNRLVYGRMAIAFGMNWNAPRCPRIGAEGRYVDWRSANGPIEPSAKSADFDYTNNIADDAWRRTLVYLEHYWRSVLVA